MLSSDASPNAPQKVSLPTFEEMCKGRQVDCPPFQGREGRPKGRIIQQESREQATQRLCDQMLERTKEQCDALLSQAQETVMQMLAQAQEERDVIYQQAAQQAAADAQNACDALKNTQMQEFSAIVTSFEKERDALYDRVQKKLSTTVIGLASRIIFTELDRNDTVFCNIIDNVMTYIQSDTLHEINVCVEDYERYIQKDTTGYYAQAERAGIMVRPSKRMEHGDIAMTYDHGNIDASISKQLKRAQFALQEEE